MKHQNYTVQQIQLLGYEVFKVIAYNQYSQVYLVLKDGQQLVVKLIKKSETTGDRFKQESYLQNRFYNQFMATFVQYKEIGDFYAIFMEYTGIDLNTYANILRQPKYQTEYLQQKNSIIKTVFSQVSIALAILHHHQIVHNDLKLHNITIMFSNKRTQLDSKNEKILVKLIDFGSAIDLNTEVTESQNQLLFQCTPKNYCTKSVSPPEALKEGPIPVSCATDIWSFGVLLFEMIFHRNPFQNQGSYTTAEVTQTRAKLNQNDFTRDITGIMPIVDALFRMLRDKPTARPSIFQLLREPDLQQIALENSQLSVKERSTFVGLIEAYVDQKVNLQQDCVNFFASRFIEQLQFKQNKILDKKIQQQELFETRNLSSPISNSALSTRSISDIFEKLHYKFKNYEDQQMPRQHRTFELTRYDDDYKKDVDFIAYDLGQDFAQIQIKQIQNIKLMKDQNFTLKVEECRSIEGRAFVIVHKCSEKVSTNLNRKKTEKEYILRRDPTINLQFIAILINNIRQLHNLGMVCIQLNPATVFIDRERKQYFLRIGSIIIDSQRNQQFDPPEETQPCFSADMWALGVFIYLLNTGDYPFGSNKSKIQQNKQKLDYNRGKLNQKLIPIVKMLLQLYDNRVTSSDFFSSEEVVHLLKENLPTPK